RIEGVGALTGYGVGESLGADGAEVVPVGRGGSESEARRGADGAGSARCSSAGRRLGRWARRRLWPRGGRARRVRKRGASSPRGGGGAGRSGGSRAFSGRGGATWRGGRASARRVVGVRDGVARRRRCRARPRWDEGSGRRRALSGPGRASSGR